MASDTWDDYAADWDTEPDVREYSEYAFSSFQHKVAPLVSNMPEIRVMDFGCGTGLLTEKLAPLCQCVVAVDTSTRMIEVLDNKIAKAGIKNVTSLVATIDSKSIKKNRDILGQFGLVVASSVCSFLPDFEATLCHIAAIMKPGGVFVHWDWMDDLPADRIRNAFSGAGINCLTIEREFAMNGRNESKAVVMGIGKIVK